MAWEDTLLDASFRGVIFDCVRVRDSAARALSAHEYPYLDGEDLEDLGRKGRHISMTAVFFGEDYETRLQAFIKVLDQRGAGELIHPVFGSIKAAQVADYDVEHDAENVDYCTMTLLFRESTPGNPFFVQQLPVQKAQAASQLASLGKAKGIDLFASALDGIKAIKGNLGALTALRSVLTGTLGAIRGQVKGFIGTTLDLIDFPRAFAGDLVGMLAGMVDLRSFDVGVIMSDWKSLVGQMDGVVKLPAQVASGTAFSSGPSSGGEGGGPGGGDAPGTPAASKPIPANPEHVAIVTALVQVAVATSLAEAAATILEAEADEPTLSPHQVEQIANDVRDSIQAAIETHRTLFLVDEARPVVQALRDVAAGVQATAIVVIDARPPLVRRVVDSPGNLHLVAHRWYGDFTRAAELLRLNPQLRNPNTLQAGDVLYAYA